MTMTELDIQAEATMVAITSHVMIGGPIRNIFLSKKYELF